MIGGNVKILDVGCGDGSLLEIISSRGGNVRAVGIELSQGGVNECVKKGFSVIQGDADRDLEGYIDGVFDWVILSHVIQSVRNPQHVLRRVVEIGKKVIVSFYNAAFWRNRIAFAFCGRIPRRPDAQYNQVDATYRRCSIKDFLDLCNGLGLVNERTIVLGMDGREIRRSEFHNWLGYQAICVLSKEVAVGGKQ
jgi:methionine biosynthesis protein MetW